MKILRLQIRNIRGIRDFEHDFNGKNAVIFGQNGTGKSSVLDAIDFLLTGNISRLQGEGTRGISLQKHGIHVDMDKQPSSGYVAASVLLQNHATPTTIKRTVKDPANLQCCESAKTVLGRIRRHALQGQHLLQRRRMLRFVHVKPSDRGSQIQTLLGLEKVNDTRGSLQRVTNRLKDKRNIAVRDFERSCSIVKTYIGMGNCEEGNVLEAVNSIREELGLENISSLSQETIRQGIRSVDSAESVQNSPTVMLENFTHLEKQISYSRRDSFRELEIDLREKLHAIRADPELLHSMKRIELIRLGLELVETDACPLCDRHWTQNELDSYLRRKVDKAKDANDLVDEINSLASAMNEHINDVLARLPAKFAESDYVSDSQAEVLVSWRTRLDALSMILQDSLTLYPDVGMSVAEVANLFVTDSLVTTVRQVRQSLRELELTSTMKDNRVETAREKLTLVADRWPELEADREKLQVAACAFDRAVVLEDAYLKARDRVLQDTYGEVSAEFTNLYRRLHSRDESSFESNFRPQGAALHWDVDFYSRGTYPPHAMHSEGHQDTMGLCLFLVLSRRLSGHDLELMMLDDVVTSVDVGHRKALARLLKDEFGDRQIIIVTHDKTWFEQLRRVQFVSDRVNMLEFLGWSIQSGPTTVIVPEVWDKIEKDLEDNDVNAAAAKLRHWAESFFRTVCDSLQIPVRYRIDQLWTLGDFYDAGRGGTKSLLKKAKSAAHKAKDKDLQTELQALDDHRGQIYESIESERWMVNTAVHYNLWENLTVDEFSDAIKAFRSLADLLHCDECSGLLRVTDERDFITCGCGETRWRL